MAWQPLAQDVKTSDVNISDVIVVGAGISGINFGYRLQERTPHLSYTILEGRHEIGGTWSLFKYPGVRSDSDLYTFGFSWRPWNQNSSIARGELIRDYLKESAQIHGIDKKIRYGHQVKSAAYSSGSKTWTLSATVGEKTTTFKARFLLLGTGYYDYHTPLQTSIPGIESFEGPVVHPQFWPEDLDYTGKDVVVVGSGATAVTVLPVMAKTASHVTMLQRSPGYVVSIETEDAFERFMRSWFSWWPAFQQSVFRMKWILASLLITTLSAAFPERMQAYIYKRTDKLLPTSVPRDPHFTPKYFPWQQRMCLCPDGDFFEGLHSGKASIETGIIKTVTPKSIQLASGKELRPDIIVTATGLKLQFAGGIALSVDGVPYDTPSKFIWKGLMLEDLPNAAFSIGYVDASWTLGADATAQLVCRMLNQMRNEQVVEVIPRRSQYEKQNMKANGLLRLNSTYVTKAGAVNPSAGDTGQWIPRSHFMRDIWNAWFGDIKTSMEWVKDSREVH